MNTERKKLVILVSGRGSNLQAVINSIKKGEIDYDIELVVSNNKNAYALKRAEKAGIPALYVPCRKDLPREEYDYYLAEQIKIFSPDYILLLGWMRILTGSFISCFPDRIINLHPALPGSFPGVEAISRQYDAFMSGRIKECGIMTHYVSDEGVDTGPVILTHKVSIKERDSIESFEKKVHDAEHKLVIKTLKKLCTEEDKVFPTNGF